MTILEKLSHWMHRTPKEHSEKAIQNAKLSFEDVIACIHAGVSTYEARAVQRTVLGWGTGSAMVIGLDAKTAPPFAALVNGTAAHALDYDDTFMLSATHASAVMVPALLALASDERTGEVSGAALIDAYIIGLQVQYFLALGCMRSHSDLGWHTTGTLGTIGAAAACARLLKLEQPQTTAALSLATSTMAGMKIQFGTGAKPLHAGLAAQHAVQAATLAQQGLTGNPSAIEGQMGFTELYVGTLAQGWDCIDRALESKELVIESQGLMIKRFPCCAATHRAMDCALELQAEHAIDPHDIASIEAHIGYGHARNLMYPIPKSPIEARFSMQYCLAAALLNPYFGLGDFTQEALGRVDVRQLMQVISVCPYSPELSKLPHKVVITLKSGDRFEGERDAATGTINYPLSYKQRKQKFDDCCRQLSEGGREGLWEMLQGLDSLPTVQGLLNSLQGHAASLRAL